MRKFLMPAIASSLLAFAGSAQGGQITNLQLYDGGNSPTATINYTGANGSGSYSAYVYADPQVSSGTTNPVFYCVDLWHDNYLGSTYTITPVSSMSFANSTFADVDNRIGWLLSQDQSTPEARAAVQLAIWYTIDNKPDGALNGFSMSTSNATITNDYNGLIAFGGYNPAQNYEAQFWQATHDGGNRLYQDLVSTVGTNFHLNAVPEPSSLVMGGCGVVFLFSAVVRRRLRRTESAR
jgi:Thioester domain